MNFLKHLMLALFAFSLTTFVKSMEVEENELNFGDLQNIIQDNYIAKLPKIKSEKIVSEQDLISEVANFIQQFDGSIYFYDKSGIEELKGKIEQYVKNQETIKCVIVGFPCKSSNTENKVLGDTVDLGEFLALFTLNYLCEQIKKVYSPGANVLIFPEYFTFFQSINEKCKELSGQNYCQKEVFDKYQDGITKIVRLFPNLRLSNRSKYEQLYSEKYASKTSAGEALQLDEEEFKQYDHFFREELNCSIWKLAIEKHLFNEKKDGICKEVLRRQEIKKKVKSSPKLYERLKDTSFEEIQKCKNSNRANDRNFYKFYVSFIQSQLGIRQHEIVLSKALACEVMNLRGQTRQLIENEIENYDKYIRFSSHLVKNGSCDVSKKLGISLVFGSAGTPWHHAPMVSAKGISLVKRKDGLKEGSKKCININDLMLAYIDKLNN